MSEGIFLTDDDVVSMDTHDQSLTNAPTATMREIKAGLSKLLPQHWSWHTGGGATCRVLQVQGGGWLRGRIRLRIEFIPFEEDLSGRKQSLPQKTIAPVLESPLDELRSDLNIK